MVTITAIADWSRGAPGSRIPQRTKGMSSSSSTRTALNTPFRVCFSAKTKKVTAEMARVVRPGGRVVVLEITTPARLRRFYGVWFDRVVPWLGRLLGRDGAAYSYLPASVRRFPEPPQLAASMAAAGLRDVRWRPLAAGIVAVAILLLTRHSTAAIVLGMAVFLLLR